MGLPSLTILPPACSEPLHPWRSPILPQPAARLQSHGGRAVPLYAVRWGHAPELAAPKGLCITYPLGTGERQAGLRVVVLRRYTLNRLSMAEVAHVVRWRLAAQRR